MRLVAKGGNQPQIITQRASGLKMFFITRNTNAFRKRLNAFRMAPQAFGLLSSNEYATIVGIVRVKELHLAASWGVVNAS